ncbi:hypothetical protein DZE39_000021 [Clostridium beijerinckii]|nr:hypothetical protein [Clostridium beijerinckii]
MKVLEIHSLRSRFYISIKIKIKNYGYLCLRMRILKGDKDVTNCNGYKNKI